MNENEFWKEVIQSIDMPFESTDVVNIENDPSGAVYVDTRDGNTYALYFTLCERDEEQD